MKLQDTTTTIEKIGNVTGESQFKMKTSRKAFQILSDLYSDKPLAIVRELGCNASDSHVAAGTPDKPFHIHLPNTLEPWLTIQDFGTGITHKNIYDIYATYFESTKTNTNSQIGCLGLGSKSPFCYTDNFSITSIVDGEKRVYNAYFNENNTPAISLMSTEATTDHNGVAIQIPIKPDDFNNFLLAVVKAFRFFDVKPTISGGKIDWNIEKPIFEGKGWSSYEKLEYGQSFAIMGGVTYVIDRYKIDSKYRNLLEKAGLVIKFEMGELDFTPSRESLSYCESTIKALNDKLEFITQDFQKSIINIIDNKPNILEAIKAVYFLNQKFSYINSIKFGDITWNGINISNPIEFIHKLAKEGVTTMKRTSWGRQKYNMSTYPSLDTNSVWYYVDMTRGTEARVKFYLKDETNRNKVITLFSEEVYKKLVAEGFPKESFLPASSLPKVVHAKRVRSSSNIQKGDFCVYRTGVTHRESWESHDFDPANPPKYYIVKPSKGWDFTLEITGLKSVTNKSSLHTILDYMKINYSDVVMVSQRNIEYIEDVSQPLEDYINDNIVLNVNADDYANYCSYNFYHIKSITKLQAFKDLPNNNPFKMFLEKVHNSMKNVESYHRLAGLINMTKGIVLSYSHLNDAQKMLIKKIGNYGWEPEVIVTLVANLKD